jgi:hypothetical protein
MPIRGVWREAARAGRREKKRPFNTYSKHTDYILNLKVFYVTNQSGYLIYLLTDNQKYVRQP